MWALHSETACVYSKNFRFFWLFAKQTLIILNNVTLNLTSLHLFLITSTSSVFFIQLPCWIFVLIILYLLIYNPSNSNMENCPFIRPPCPPKRDRNRLLIVKMILSDMLSRSSLKKNIAAPLYWPPNPWPPVPQPWPPCSPRPRPGHKRGIKK